MIKIYSPFSLPDNWSDLTAIKCEDVSLATQADKDDSDINTIVRRFGLTGELPVGVRLPEFGDFSSIPNDYHAAKNFMLSTDEAFLEFPAEVRARFNNDAGAFLDFFNNPANQDEAIKLGLAIDSRPPVEPQAPPEVETGGNKP